MKIDVEGHEETVLRAAAPVLAERPPPVVIFESNRDQRPFWERGAIRVLADMDYELFGFGRGLFACPLVHVPRGAARVLECNDYVALHRGDSFAECKRVLGCAS
jgi:hypothetical protein